MADQIGTITVPALVASTDPFPIRPDFGIIKTVTPQVITHRFPAGNAKREQRYYLGSGATQWQLTAHLCLEDYLAFVEFYDTRLGPYEPFHFLAPNPDGTTTDTIVQFANAPQTFQADPNLHYVSVNLIAANIADSAGQGPYTSAKTLLRFPDSAMFTALTAQAQTCIPLLHIKVKKSGYVDNLYFSDRRVTVDGQLYLPRLLRWDGVEQVAVGLPGFSGESDNAQFVLGNADRVMRQLADDVQLDFATVEFSIFHVDQLTKINFWAGIISPGGWQSSAGPEFTITCSDPLSSPYLIAPPRTADRKCDKMFDGPDLECPFGSASTGMDSEHFPLGDPTVCDHGYDTPNGCLAHGMIRYYNGIFATPQAVRTKDNTTGVMGIGRSFITSASLISDSIYGQVIPIVVTDVDIPVKALLFAGRDEGDFYEAGGVVCEGPVVFKPAIGLPGQLSPVGLEHTLDGQLWHGYPNTEGSDGGLSTGDVIVNRQLLDKPVNTLGLGFKPGTDPAGETDFFSLDENGDKVNGDFRKIYFPSSTYLNNFAAGIAFCIIRRSDKPGIQLSTLEDHSMECIISKGWQGWTWTAPGARITGSLTNPVWLAINLYLRCLKLWRVDSATQEQYFDVMAAINAAQVCDTVVKRLVEEDEGEETQFKFIGKIDVQRPLRDWINDILINCCGYYNFAFGKLRIGIRDNASALAAYTAGNMLYQTLQVSALGPKFNRVKCLFADREHGWVTNAAKYQDDDYAVELGGGTRPFYLDAEFTLPGTADISQAARIAVVRGREEVGGVNETERKGCRRAAWSTTLLGLDTEPGMVVSITDEEFTGKVRVERIRLNPDYSIQIVARGVTASMYDLVTGPKPVDVRPSEIPPEFFAQPLRPVWHPNQDIAAEGDAIDDVNDHTFGLAQRYTVLANGERQAEAVVTGKTIVTSFVPNTSGPIIRHKGFDITGGLLLGGRSYYFNVWAYTENGKLSPPSNVIAIHVPDGDDNADTNVVHLANIQWPPDDPDDPWVGYSVGGSMDYAEQMCVQEHLDGTPLPKTVPIGVHYMYRSTWNPPTNVVRKIRIKAKRMIHSGNIGAEITTVSENTFVVHSLAGLGDDWNGRRLSILARKTALDTPEVNFTITGYDSGSGTFTVTPDPVAAGILAKDILTIRFDVTTGTATEIGDAKIVNGIYPDGIGTEGDEEVGRLIYLRTEKGRWQIRTVIGNTNSVYTVDVPFDPIPQPGDFWFVAERDWIYFGETSPAPNGLEDTKIEIKVVMNNFVFQPILIGAFTVDSRDQETQEQLVHLRDMYLFGDPNTNLNAAPFDVVKGGDGYLTVDNVEITDNEGVGAITSLNFTAPAIDETDVLWYGDGTIDDAATSFTPGIAGVSVHPGRDFKVGSCFQWNDPTNYEICKITAIDGGVWTIARGQYGTGASAHTSQHFYYVEPRLMPQAIKNDLTGQESPVTTSGIPKRYEWSYANQCVASVRSQAAGQYGKGAIHDLPLAGFYTSGLNIEDKPAPGYRTLRGGMYTIGCTGTLSYAQTADVEIPVRTFESIHCVWGVLIQPSDGDLDVVAHIYWINADRSQAGLIDSVAISSATFKSYNDGDGPHQRQMPYHQSTLKSWVPTNAGQYDWPPNLLPAMQDAIVDGIVVPTFSLAPETAVLFQPGGMIGLVIGQVGETSPGGDLVIAIQT